MKTVATMLAAVALVAVSNAYAQSDSNSLTDPTLSMTPTRTVDSTSTGGVEAGQTQSGSPRITRGDVRQQLIQAERSGELQRLDAGIYRGGN